ncbi:MAG: hypothetical protein D6820_12790 [Lentisphaerae bacterium]|nr:MAG: hypothetical protein D6820_12790 [Lentisphaerota bacterium]
MTEEMCLTVTKRLSGKRRYLFLLNYWVGIMLSISLGFAANSRKKPRTGNMDPKDNPAFQAMLKAYLYIREGNEKDLERNQRMLQRYQQRLQQAQRLTDSKKRATYTQAYQRLVELYTKLIEINKTILGMFDGSSRRFDVEYAMEKLPRIEQEIVNITHREIKREWLTFNEVKARLHAGWIPKTPDPEILPYGVDCWEKPKPKTSRTKQ